MSLPSPLPDDPRKWDGWSQYISNNPYARLCLDFESKPTDEQIEENCRQLLVWWQKKLPLKNQPSNPLAQMLRGGIDNAPRCITEARVELLNPTRRSAIDNFLGKQRREDGLNEFRKLLEVALANRIITLETEAYLQRTGSSLGLSESDIKITIEAGMRQKGNIRAADVPPEPVSGEAEDFLPEIAPPGASNGTEAIPYVSPKMPSTRRVRNRDAKAEFRRLLELSGLDEDSMSDDRRDTMIDMAENMGLEPGLAEDMVDEYLEGVTDGTIPLRRPASASDAPLPAPPIRPPTPVMRSTPSVVAAKPSTVAPPRTTPQVAAAVTPVTNRGPGMTSEEEEQRYPSYSNSAGIEMLLIPSASFQMGSTAMDAQVNEQPISRVVLTRYYLARFPVTNAQFEKFSPAHKSRRAPWADDRRPVIYVSALEAAKFCEWLSAKERRRYRLPTEAEWEYAAKSGENRTFPWGETGGRGDLANFADRNTTFAWRDANVDDGYAETAPVGSYPNGASPFGPEDMAGNVWEWCLDFYGEYSKAGERLNPRGPQSGTQRVYRGGSWKSRFSNLRTTARGFNLPTYASNDVGFRVVCECD